MARDLNPAGLITATWMWTNETGQWEAAPITFHVSDILTYFRYKQPSSQEYTAIRFRSPMEADFPRWLNIPMPFAEFDQLFRDKLAAVFEDRPAPPVDPDNPPPLP